MQRLCVRISAAAVVVSAVACRTSARVSESDAERLSGCFRRIYGDPPPSANSGSVFFALTTDAGETQLLEVSPALLASAGGPTLLDRARVSVVIAPPRDSSGAKNRAVRVREIKRESAASAPAC
jgi:hypothetical protein